jgi:hypothetical protein
VKSGYERTWGNAARVNESEKNGVFGDLRSEGDTRVREEHTKTGEECRLRLQAYNSWVVANLDRVWLDVVDGEITNTENRGERSTGESGTTGDGSSWLRVVERTFPGKTDWILARTAGVQVHPPTSSMASICSR